jgi:hypothetical protein
MIKHLERKNKPVKTMNVSEFREHINYLLTCDFTQEEKKAFCLVLQDVLHSTRQYNGFNYSAWNNGGFLQWRKDGEPKDNTPYLGLEYDRYYY